LCSPLVCQIEIYKHGKGREDMGTWDKEDFSLRPRVFPSLRPLLDQHYPTTVGLFAEGHKSASSQATQTGERALQMARP
jgi:hypothetical protein